jgi:hypothetical protein
MTATANPVVIHGPEIVTDVYDEDDGNTPGNGQPAAFLAPLTEGDIVPTIPDVQQEKEAIAALLAVIATKAEKLGTAWPSAAIGNAQTKCEQITPRQFQQR